MYDLNRIGWLLIPIPSKLKLEINFHVRNHFDMIQNSIYLVSNLKRLKTTSGFSGITIFV